MHLARIVLVLLVASFACVVREGEAKAVSSKDDAEPAEALPVAQAQSSWSSTVDEPKLLPMAQAQSSWGDVLGAYNDLADSASDFADGLPSAEEAAAGLSTAVTVVIVVVVVGLVACGCIACACCFCCV